MWKNILVVFMVLSDLNNLIKCAILFQSNNFKQDYRVFHDLTFSNFHILFHNIARQPPQKYENMKYLISN